MHGRLVEGGATHGVPSPGTLQLTYTSQPINATTYVHARPSSIQDATPSAVFLVHRGIPHRSSRSKIATTGVRAKARTHPLQSLRTARIPSNRCGQHASPPIAADSTRLSSTTCLCDGVVADRWTRRTAPYREGAHMTDRVRKD